MKNQNLVGLCIMLLVVLAIQAVIGIASLSYIAIKGIYGMAKPKSIAPPSATYASIFEPIEPIIEQIKPIAQTPQPIIADPWGEAVTVKARKPRGKRSIAQLIEEAVS